MRYVDGFVTPVPIANKETYIKLAREAWEMFREGGAIEFVECWGDDVRDGKVTDFRRAVDAKEDETVCFSWIVYPSKEVRDEANRKMEEAMAGKPMDLPFDGKRMVWGGFMPIVDERA